METTQKVWGTREKRVLRSSRKRGERERVRVVLDIESMEVSQSTIHQER